MSLPHTLHGMRPGLVSTAMRPGRVSASAPRAGIPRKTLTDKLGIPENATDADMLAALDAKLAAKKQNTAQTPAQPQQGDDDALYDALYAAEAPAPLSSAEEALYAAYTGTAEPASTAPVRDEADLWARVMGA